MKYKIPTEISTERLKLRIFKENDWKDLYSYYSDAECMRYTVGRSLADWEVWRQIALMIGHWKIRGFGPYAMEDMETGNVLGPVGMWYPLEWPEPEIKWGLSKKYWGKGYAKKAANAVRLMAIKHVPDLNLISLINKDNLNSINLAESIGAVYEKTIDFRETTASIYRHKR
jgi:RimJ/RimL family protein N-acetyltransferase